MKVLNCPDAEAEAYVVGVGTCCFGAAFDRWIPNKVWIVAIRVPLSDLIGTTGFAWGKTQSSHADMLMFLYILYLVNLAKFP
jgi:hypothetical protein